MQLPTLTLDLNAPEKFGNVAERLNQDERRRMATDLIELVGIDENSMSEWAGKAEGYLDELDPDDGAGTAPKDREQEGSGEEPPPSTELTLSSIIQFSARATQAILGEPDLAKASEPGGEALAGWVSSQLRTEDPNWILETDPLVVHMSATGLAWRKRTFDDIDKVFHSYFLPSVGDNSVIINASVRNITRAPRITHQFTRYPYEIERSISRKHWIDYGPVYDERDPQAPKKFYEVDLWMDLDDDGIDEPWTVTISRDDHAEVVKIQARWSKKTIVQDDDVLFFRPIRRYYPYAFLPDPKGGFFPMGFGRLLRRVEGSADRLLAAIIDTAETEGENGGVLAGGGVGVPDKIEVKGNRVTTVPTDGRKLADMYENFPVKSVSAGSVAALEKLQNLGERLAGTLNLLQDAPASMTATMARGILDTGTQIQGAVHRRIVNMMTQEFRMFVQMADAYDQLPKETIGANTNAVAVTADPTLATEMQRSALAGIYFQMLETPGWNVQEIQRRIAEVLRLPNPQALIGQPRAPEATPDEKIKGVLGLMKQRTENIKVIGGVAVQLTQAIKNLVDANGGMIDTRAALLNMALLEDSIQRMIAENSNAGNDLGGVAAQPANANVSALPAPPQADGAGAVPEGGAAGPDPAGAGIMPS